jgi:putative membrane-bound dehydrogenase-like protein
MRKAHIAAIPLALALSACGKHYADQAPHTAQEELQTIHVLPGFKVELFASEPLVYDPVEMVWDENGRLFVAEMLDYPEDPPPGQPARSRIVMLEDTNGDGIADKRTIFADNVLEVSGLMPWKGGLIVTSAPDILYMKDTDGDGKADVRKVLYTGFPKVNPEGRITNPRLNLDNWVYCSNEGQDSRITSPDHPDRPPILARGADFRFRLDRDAAEVASGPTQFGQGVDMWGNRFIGQNTVHIRQVVLPMQYLVRAPTLDVGAVSQDISDHGKTNSQMFPLTQPQQWRRERTKLRQERYNENKLNRTEYVGGYFTAATGDTVYDGDVFPKEFWGNVFLGDVSANLVHRDVISRNGVDFIAHRADVGKEFLASTDVWFRPCNFSVAPDGNLYISDIYREFIETPESIPEQLRKMMDFWSGSDKGRIYRVVPEHPERKRDLKPNLGKASSAELVELLASTSGWHRMTAHRLLMERQDRAVIPQLVQMASTHEWPQARAQALWVLESINAVDEKLVLQALADKDPNVKIQALRLAEPFLAKSKTIAAAVEKLPKDTPPEVEFQQALSLGREPEAPVKVLAAIAERHADDRWFRLAVLASAADNPSGLFQAVHDFGKGELLAQIGTLIGTRHDAREMSAFLAGVGRVPKPEIALAGLAKGLRLASVTELQVPGAEASLARYLESKSPAVQTAAWDVARHLELKALLARAAHDAQTKELPERTRITAIRALGGGRYATAGPILRQILDQHEGPAIDAAAIESLAAFDDPQIGTILMADWKSYGPQVRTQVIAAMLNQRDRLPALLTALEKKEIDPANIDMAARARLMEQPDAEVASRAKAIFQNQSSDRAKVVAAYQDALKLNGNVAHGKQLFEENCGKCHLPRKQGPRVGPDLSGINNKTKEELLTSILNPSYAIEPRYTYYMVTTKDGRMHDGVISNETPGMVTLRGGTEDGDDTILRKNIAEMRASHLSLMPDGLEDSLGKQGLADVISYLRGGL